MLEIFLGIYFSWQSVFLVESEHWMLCITSTYTQFNEREIYTQYADVNISTYKILWVSIEILLWSGLANIEVWLFSLHRWIFISWSRYSVVLTQMLAMWIKLLLNRILENLIHNVKYIIHIYIRHQNCKYLPKMLTQMLAIIFDISFVMKLCFPCGNLILNVGYYFHIDWIQLRDYIYHLLT